MELGKGFAFERDKQLYSHARALDVLIATLFKRLYNFQSFHTAFCALVANGGDFCGGKVLGGILNNK
jgi:hypothetical protein